MNTYKSLFFPSFIITEVSTNKLNKNIENNTPAGASPNPKFKRGFIVSKTFGKILASVHITKYNSIPTLPTTFFLIYGFILLPRNFPE